MKNTYLQLILKFNLIFFFNILIVDHYVKPMVALLLKPRERINECTVNTI